MFTRAGFAIYVQDDYVVRSALWKRGYVLVIIGGGITGFVQVNDTHMHRPIEAVYRLEESKKMLQKLEI